MWPTTHLKLSWIKGRENLAPEKLTGRLAQVDRRLARDSELMKILNDAKVELQLGLVGMLVMIGLVATTLWFMVANAPFESKNDAAANLRFQAQLNSQLTLTLHDISQTQTDLASRISDLQDDEIQIQQWLMDNQNVAHPYVPRDHAKRQPMR